MVNEDFGRENDQTILAQINYCRFLMRLVKLTDEHSQIDSPFLKERLIFLILKNVMIKVNKLRDLCSGRKNQLGLLNYDCYVKNDSFQKFVIVIQEYYTKYQSVFNEKWKYIFMPQMSELSQDKKFREIFDVNFEENDQFYFSL